MLDPSSHCCSSQKSHTDQVARNKGKSFSCGSSLVFPFHLCNVSTWGKCWPYRTTATTWLANSFRVHAAERGASYAEKHEGSIPQETQQGVLESERASSVTSSAIRTFELEMLARAYIEQETGTERVRMIFKKDHTGKNSPEMEYMQVALVQTFVISFLMKYIPEFRLAKQEFIREHHGTVFRTRLEAVRRMQDHVSLRAATAGGKFAAKITAFGASFILLSQMIASYRNKSSVLEYAAAAGITGGLARIQLGVKGFIAGSFLGSVLGSLVGCLAYAVFKAHDATQEQRHVHAIMSLLEVQQSLEGETEFKKKIQDVRRNELAQKMEAS